jgi:hypothetical protein
VTREATSSLRATAFPTHSHSSARGHLVSPLLLCACPSNIAFLSLSCTPRAYLVSPSPALVGHNCTASYLRRSSRRATADARDAAEHRRKRGGLTLTHSHPTPATLRLPLLAHSSCYEKPRGELRPTRAFKEKQKWNLAVSLGTQPSPGPKGTRW